MGAQYDDGRIFRENRKKSPNLNFLPLHLRTPFYIIICNILSHSNSASSSPSTQLRNKWRQVKGFPPLVYF